MHRLTKGGRGGTSGWCAESNTQHMTKYMVFINKNLNVKTVAELSLVFNRLDCWLVVVSGVRV